RALRTRLWPLLRLRSPAAMRPTRRSTACSVVRSRSKNRSFTRTVFALKNAAHLRGVFFRPRNSTEPDAIVMTSHCPFSAAALAFALLFVAHVAPAGAAAPQNYLFAGSIELESIEPLITRREIAGVQVVYSWKSLEKGKDAYDFSRIE